MPSLTLAIEALLDLDPEPEPILNPDPLNPDPCPRDVFYNRYNTGKPALVIVGGAIGGAMFFAGARRFQAGGVAAVFIRVNRPNNP